MDSRFLIYCGVPNSDPVDDIHAMSFPMTSRLAGGMVRLGGTDFLFIMARAKIGSYRDEESDDGRL